MHVINSWEIWRLKIAILRVLNQQKPQPQEHLVVQLLVSLREWGLR